MTVERMFSRTREEVEAGVSGTMDSQKKCSGNTSNMGAVVVGGRTISILVRPLHASMLCGVCGG